MPLPSHSPSPLPPPSAVSTSISQTLTSNTSPTHADHLLTLALEVKHNLSHQHDWTLLRLHTHSPLTSRALPRPLLSGLPPNRIYIHPDEQKELLKRGVKGEEVAPQREWVLPTRLRERWTLRGFAEVFEGLGVVPAGGEEGGGDNGEEGGGGVVEKGVGDEGERKWRKTKRLLLATVDADSTVVYYIVHDGLVKPRQN